MQYLHQQAAALLAFSLEENNEPVKKYIQGYTGNHTASSAEYSQLFLSDLALDHVGFRPYLDCGKPLYATPDTARYLPTHAYLHTVLNCHVIRSCLSNLFSLASW